ncbi:hypothetical protein [Polaribacter sp. 11A2H]|uniref:hypothetical protein n=1 Tax=Polaribacter sp. 11A2H TaxID=2687290 RepID=UPI00140CF945|nr:hypothetical protein [Polaribacter sp. 11A2H]
MSKDYDRFITNIGEISGEISRKPFTFSYDKFEVLRNESVVYNVKTPSRIRGSVEDRNLKINIVGNDVDKYLNKSLFFNTISYNIDNIRWSLEKPFEEEKLDSTLADYVAMFYLNGVLSKISFVIHKTGMQINFFSDKSSTLLKPLSELCIKARKAIQLYGKGNKKETIPLLLDVYRSVKRDPQQLKFVEDYENLGNCFLVMLDIELSDDVDILQMMVSVGYLCTSLAIEDNSENIKIYQTRLLLLRIGNIPFRYTVMEALNLTSKGLFSMSSNLAVLKARDAIYKMEMIDLENNPKLCYLEDFFKKRKDKLKEMVDDDFFIPERTLINVLISGTKNHQELLTYIENKVIVNGDIDF